MIKKYKDKLINPVSIPYRDLPLIVLVDNRRKLIPWLIKIHTSGQYSHTCEHYSSFFIASQDIVGYRKVHITKYLKPHIFLKFWKVELNPSQRAEWIKMINEDLKKKGSYDILGIIGHILRMPWINAEKLDYCSEVVARHQNAISDIDLPHHPSPVGLDRVFQMIDKFSVYGYWFFEGEK